MSYTSAETATSAQPDWTPAGAATVCQPEYSKVPPPAPSLQWNELCCTEEEGNEMFGGNFWGNLSIRADLPPGADEEDLKIIYRVEPFNPAGAVYLRESFSCERSDFEVYFHTSVHSFIAAICVMTSFLM